MRDKSGRSSAGQGEAIDLDVSYTKLFALIWDAIADILGTAAVAAIVRRAAQNAAVEHPELVDLVVLRENLGYRYTLPTAWSKTTQVGLRGQGTFRVLVAEMGRLLVELTGTVVISRLEQIPELRDRRLVWREEAK